MQNEPVKKVVKIPENMSKFNVFIQVKSLSKNTNLTYFSTSLNVQIIETYAQIKVSDKENKPLSKVLLFFVFTSSILIFEGLCEGFFENKDWRC